MELVWGLGWCGGVLFCHLGFFSRASKILLGGYCVFIIEVIVIGKLGVDVEFFYCVKVVTFLLVKMANRGRNM